MNTTLSLPISVLYYNDLLSTWITAITNDYQETKDEYKYFRVLSNGKKTFYKTPEDYFYYNNVTLIGDSKEFTTVNNEIIYLGKNKSYQEN
jgi:hypothetical protein